MARCEDFPCCGHERDCCPSYSDAGEQLDIVCTCGARLPINSRYSICDGCMSYGDRDEGTEMGGDYDYSMNY